MSAKDEMLDQVKGYLDRNGWHYDDSLPDTIKCGVRLKSTLGSVDMRICFGEEGYTVLDFLRIKANDEHLDEVMRFITMLNYRIRNGNFEMDLSDGEVRYRLYTHFSGLLVLPDEIIEESVTIPPATIDYYGNGLAAVMMGFSDADTELRKLERDEDDDEDDDGEAVGEEA